MVNLKNRAYNEIIQKFTYPITLKKKLTLRNQNINKVFNTLLKRYIQTNC